jgi:hypothetical protein
MIVALLLFSVFLPFFTSKLDERPESKNAPCGAGSTSLCSVNPCVGGFKENDCRVAPFFLFSCRSLQASLTNVLKTKMPLAGQGVPRLAR